MQELIIKRIPEKEIKRRRRKIYNKILKGSPNIRDGTITAIAPSDLGQMFLLYDQAFFQNWFNDCYKGKVKFSLSKRMTKSAGMTLCPKNINSIKPDDLVLEIRIGVNFFFNYDTIKGSKKVNGLESKNSLEALLLVFEHELCHVIEYLKFGKSNCSSEHFKSVAKNLFGHSETFHMIPTVGQIVKQMLGFGEGDTVTFEFEGRQLAGIISNINKRATVMVRNNDGPMIDKEGNRYEKYYVPILLLRKK